MTKQRWFEFEYFYKSRAWLRVWGWCVWAHTWSRTSLSHFYRRTSPFYFCGCHMSRLLAP